MGCALLQLTEIKTGRHVKQSKNSNPSIVADPARFVWRVLSAVDEVRRILDDKPAPKLKNLPVRKGKPVKTESDDSPAVNSPLYVSNNQAKKLRRYAKSSRKVFSIRFLPIRDELVSSDLPVSDNTEPENAENELEPCDQDTDTERVGCGDE